MSTDIPGAMGMKYLVWHRWPEAAPPVQKMPLRQYLVWLRSDVGVKRYGIAAVVRWDGRGWHPPDMPQWHPHVVTHWAAIPRPDEAERDSLEPPGEA